MLDARSDNLDFFDFWFSIFWDFRAVDQLAYFSKSTAVVNYASHEIEIQTCTLLPWVNSRPKSTSKTLNQCNPNHLKETCHKPTRVQSMLFCEHWMAHERYALVCEISLSLSISLSLFLSFPSSPSVRSFSLSPFLLSFFLAFFCFSFFSLGKKLLGGEGVEIGCQETEVGGKVRGRTAWEYTLILTRAACKAARDSSQHSSTLWRWLWRCCRCRSSSSRHGSNCNRQAYNICNYYLCDRTVFAGVSCRHELPHRPFMGYVDPPPLILERHTSRVPLSSALAFHLWLPLRSSCPYGSCLVN